MAAHDNPPHESATPQMLGEPFAAEFSEFAFLADYVYRNPKLRRGGKEKELADTLIVFDKSAVIVQVKSFDVAARPNKSPERIKSGFRKQRRACLRQVTGAYNALVKGLVDSLENPRRQRVRASEIQISEYFGLCLIDDFAEPHELRLEWHPAVPEKLPILCMPTSDFGHFCNELSTPGDFLDYLRTRASIEPRILHRDRSELDLLATYLLDDSHFTSDSVSQNDVSVGHNSWVDYYLSARRLWREERNKPSFIVDYIISRLHTAVRHLNDEHDWDYIEDSESPRDPAYIRAATAISRLRRMERRSVGELLLHKSSLLTEDRPLRFFVRDYSSHANLFMVSTLDRTQRMVALHNLSLAAKLNIGAPTVVGVAMDSLFASECSIDSVYIDSDPAQDRKTADPQIVQYSRDYFGEPRSVTDVEFPPLPQ